jgi:hypothetical protein
MLVSKPPPPPPPKRPADQPLPQASGQAGLLKIQTFATVGLFVIALSAAGLYGFERFREARRIQVLRAYSCGAARGELRSEAARLWDEWQSYKADKRKGGEDFVMTARVRITALSEAVDNLSSDKLSAVENYCDAADIETEIKNVRSQYPGLTGW